MRSVGQHELAKRLRLSRATVSRSLANHPAISAETRARVQKLAAELGYRNNPARRTRRSRAGKPITIGVLIGIPAKNVTMATFPFILKGIRERADLDRVAVDVCYQDPGDFDPATGRNPFTRHIRGGDWRGVLLIYPFAPETIAILAQRLSTVTVLEEYGQLGVDSVDTDQAGIVVLVERLIQRGHRRIGFVTWEYAVGGLWSLRRFSAYVECLFQHGLDFNPAWVANIHKHSPRLNPPEVADFVARRIREDRVTAWVCAADHQAYQLMRDLAPRGLEVGRDYSITGFDGIEPPPGLRSLTTLRVPNEDLGASAVTRLLSRISHPNAPRRKILVEADFVEGETVAPVPR